MKLDICIYSDADDYRDVWVYVDMPTGDEWRFHYFLDKLDNTIHEGDPCYAEDSEACYDDTDKGIPNEVLAFLETNMGAIKEKLTCPTSTTSPA